MYGGAAVGSKGKAGRRSNSYADNLAMGKRKGIG
jgi:hypothetical protein